MIRALKIILPLLILVGAVVGAMAMIASKPEVETRRPEAKPPLVRVIPVEIRDLRLTVSSQGTVAPRTESQLVPEVSGRVIRVAPSFVAGGFFSEGEPLVEIDSVDYRQAVVRARAEVAQCKLRLAQEEAEAEVARREWDELGKGEANPLTLREPQLEDARAALDAAGANLESAERDLERTVVRAPFDGRVRQKSVDMGQYISRGTPVATVYSVDIAEIRLPLPDDECAFVDLPLVYRGEEATETGPRVTLRADFAGHFHEWQGVIVRTEGEIDPRSRMVHAVAQVKDPYGRRKESPDRIPLAVGMFVQAEIEGRAVQDVAVLPRTALRPNGRVFVIDPDDRLRFRTVTVLRAARDSVIVSDGLEPGERVCLSSLDVVTDGMQVRVEGETPEAAVPGERPTAEAAVADPGAGSPAVADPAGGEGR